MPASRRPLINLLGFEIRFDLTWLILVALIVWTLGAGYFPAAQADLSTATYIWMAILGAFGLFASVILHELAHSVVGRKLGMQIKGIRLFVFGGAAELAEEPPSPRVEALMVIVGPAMSIALAIVFYAAAAILLGLNVPQPVVTVLGYLAAANLILALFNLIGGMWWFLIGLFVRAAASSSYRQVIAQRILQAVPVRRLMRPDPISVSPDISVQQLTEEFLLGRSLKEVPVVLNQHLVGTVGIADVKAVPPAERPERRVADILQPIGGSAISVLARADEALGQMQQNGRGRLFILEDERLVGVLSLRDLLQHLRITSELQPDTESGRGSPSFHGPTGASAE